MTSSEDSIFKNLIDKTRWTSSHRSRTGHSKRPSEAPLLPGPSSSRTSLSSSSRLRGEDDYDEAEREEEDDDEMDLEKDGEGDGSDEGWLKDGLETVRTFGKRNFGFLLIAASQVLFSCMNWTVKILTSSPNPDDEIPTSELIFIRMFVTLTGCYLWLKYVSKDPDPLLGPKGVRGLLMFRGFTGFWGLFGIYYSLQYLSLSDATVLTFLSPGLTAILATLLLHETYTRTQAITTFVSLFGVLLIAKPESIFGRNDPMAGSDGTDILAGSDGGGSSGFGTGRVITEGDRMRAVGVALLGVLGSAGAYTTIRKIGKRANALHAVTYFAIFCCLTSIFLSIAFSQPPKLPTSTRFFTLLLLVGLFGFFAQFLLSLGLQREKAGRGSIAIFLQMPIALGVDVLGLTGNVGGGGSGVDGWSLLGAAIIVGGAFWVALEGMKKKERGGVGLSNLEEGEDGEGQRQGQGDSSEGVGKVRDDGGGGGGSLRLSSSSVLSMVRSQSQGVEVEGSAFLSGDVDAIRFAHDGGGAGKLRSSPTIEDRRMSTSRSEEGDADVLQGDRGGRDDVSAGVRNERNGDGRPTTVTGADKKAMLAEAKARRAA